MQKDNLNSLFSNNILKITGNKNGKIYFLCADGISEWDMNKEQFRTILKLSNVSAIYFNKALYVAKNNQLYRFNKDKLSLYYELPEKDTDITSIFIDTRGILWVGTSNYGLYKIDHAVGKIVNPIPKANITNIYEDGDKDIWVGSWEHGVYRLVDGNVLRYLNNPKQNSISSNFARAFCQDNQGNIWIGTFTGLDKFDKKTGQFSHYSTDTDFSGMTHNSIWCIIKDHQGTIWFGTYFGGVNYFNPDYEIYTRYKTSKSKKMD